MGVGVAVAVAAVAVSGALSAKAERESGIAEEAAAKFEAQQAFVQGKELELQAQAAETQSALEERDRQGQLDSVIASQEAIFGASGFASSGSAQAVISRGVSTLSKSKERASLQSKLRGASVKVGKLQLAEQIRQLNFRGASARRIAGIRSTASLFGSVSRVAAITSRKRS